MHVVVARKTQDRCLQSVYLMHSRTATLKPECTSIVQGVADRQHNPLPVDLMDLSDFQEDRVIDQERTPYLIANWQSAVTTTMSNACSRLQANDRNLLPQLRECTAALSTFINIAARSRAALEHLRLPEAMQKRRFRACPVTGARVETTTFEMPCAGQCRGILQTL